MVASSASELRTLFASLDKDADGWISAAELRVCMRATLGEDVPAEEAEALVASADADGDGMLCEAEFIKLALHCDAEEEDRTRGLREAFGMYEMEGEGCITPASLGRMLCKLGNERGIGECHAGPAQAQGKKGDRLGPGRNWGPYMVYSTYREE